METAEILFLISITPRRTKKKMKTVDGYRDGVRRPGLPDSSSGINYLVALISSTAILEVVTFAAGVEENVNPDLTASTV